MTVSVSQNNSRVIGVPLDFGFESRPGGTAVYNQARSVALRADPDVAAGRVLDRRQRVGADRARRHLFGVDALQPLPPVRPPRTLVLLGGLEPVGERDIPGIVVGPELVFARRRRVADAAYVSRSGQPEFHRAAEELRTVKHRIR